MSIRAPFHRVAPLLLFAASWAGCATTAVQPEEMSASAHRKEASKERANAAEERNQYDPKASRSERAGDPSFPRPDGPPSYNPTEWHLTQANKDSAHAREHEKAAAELVAFENAQCLGVAPATRAACPAMVPVTAVDDIEGGVRLRLVAGTDVDALVAHMQCHLAYARTRGFEQAADCPLYIKGVAIRVSRNADAAELVATDAAVVTELRKRAHVVGNIQR